MCPYDKICYHDKACDELLKDALELLKEQKNLIDCLVEDQVKKIDEMDELLKEQQPRLLTLEEVKQAEVVWCEWGCAEGYVVCMLFDKIDPDGDYRLIESNGGGLYYSSSEYNESWRCWSARPTAEQMKETRWDGDGE